MIPLPTITVCVAPAVIVWGRVQVRPTVPRMIEISGSLTSSSPSDMPHQIFEIDELVRFISRHLASAHRPSAVSLACTSRLLEEPALCSLWELQDSLTALIGVSPIITIDGEVCDRCFLSHSRLMPPEGNGVQRLRECMAQVPKMCDLDA